MFLHDKRHGDGVFVDAKGRKFQQKWNHGERVESQEVTK